MASQFDDQNTPRDHLKEEPLPATEARQAQRGRPVLIVLLAGLVLAMLIWVPAEWWGQSQAPEDESANRPATSSSTVDPNNSN